MYKLFGCQKFNFPYVGNEVRKEVTNKVTSFVTGEGTSVIICYNMELSHLIQSNGFITGNVYNHFVLMSESVFQFVESIQFESHPVGGTMMVVPFSTYNGVEEINVGCSIGLDTYKTSLCCIKEVSYSGIGLLRPHASIAYLITACAAACKLVQIGGLKKFQDSQDAIGR
jgi:hypothetical protein